MANVLGMNCPHCRTRARVQTSVELSATMRRVYMQCPNLACGHSWSAILEAERTISPSGIPNPAIDLPIAERRQVEAIHDVLYGNQQRSIFDENPEI